MKRRIARCITVFAYLVPPALAWWGIVEDNAAQERAHVIWKCGTRQAMIILLASTASGGLSLVATGLDFWVLRTTARPWSWTAWTELGIHSLPWLFAAYVWISLFA